MASAPRNAHWKKIISAAMYARNAVIEIIGRRFLCAPLMAKRRNNECCGSMVVATIAATIEFIGGIVF